MLCEAMCGLTLTVEDGRATRVEGDRDDPLSRGHICPKALALEDVRLDPDRVREPAVRDGHDGHDGHAAQDGDDRHDGHDRHDAGAGVWKAVSW
jgi:anaerobic selenocysteine-containing dehydrogenase